jgi:hypothetical protein
MTVSRSEISEVFTPRRENVNKQMYIDRGVHETNLYRSIKGSMHSFLFGDEIYAKCFKAGTATKKSFKETKKAGASMCFSAELAHEGQYEIHSEDKLLQSYRHLYEKHSGQQTIIALDNIETIFGNQSLMDELSDILILLDDSDYAEYRVKYLLVGVPNDVLQYFSTTKTVSSVGNRINEIPKINGLDSQQVLDFVKRGFINQLKISISQTELKRISRHIYTNTLGIPQRIHEYCECLAYCIEDNNWNYNPTLLDETDKNWVLSGLRESYIAIESHLNSDETSDGRRNQVIFALARISTHQIDTQKIGVVIAQDFPENAPESNSGIGQVLASLSKGEMPILKKINKSSFYTFADPRHLMCIRVMLFKDTETNRVKKKTFKIN